MPMLHTQPKAAHSHVRAFASGAHYPAARPLVLALGKLLFLGLSAVPSLRAAPIIAFESASEDGEQKGKPPSDPRLWIYLSVAMVLVLLGGIFAGLTIAYVLPPPFFISVQITRRAKAN
jgi:metal transporter CNNM